MSSELGQNTDISRIYEFAEFRLEADKLLLFKNGQVVTVPPKAVGVLLALVEADGKVVTKREILDKVWADTFVEETNLSHHISDLRKILGENKNSKKFIETIPRRGYRFAHAVKTPVNKERRETTFSERMLTRIVEETIVEVDDSRAAVTSEIVSPLAVAPVAVLNPPSQSVLTNRRRVFWTVFGLILLSGAAFSVWRYFNSTRNAALAVAPEIKIKRLTPDTIAYAPSISPDGASVAFVQIENNSATLWRRQLASGAMTQLTPAVLIRESNIISTRFSPDGRWIYFKQIVSDIRRSTVFRIGASGSTPQKIAENVESDFSIAPDGKQIAFTRGYRFLILADTDTGAERRNTTNSE